MPLNLAQTAISALKIGENALAAIYNGIIRVYPNEVTVSIDGANASTQSGTPGQPMNNFIYAVTPSSASSYGWTSAQISAATLTGLPTGFTATFSASGSLGSQTGTWTINTTDGNFPNTGTTITVASLTSTIAETGWGTVNVNITASSYWSANSGAVVGFIGSSGSVRAYGNTATRIGFVITTIGTGFTSTNISGQAPTGVTNGGVGNVTMVADFTYTIVSVGTYASSVGVSSNQWSQDYGLQTAYEIPGPPWNTNPVQGIQAFSRVYSGTATGNTNNYNDSRWKYKVIATWTGTSTGSAVMVGDRNIPSSQTAISYINNSMRPGNGGFVITIFTNQGNAASDPALNLNIFQVSWNWN